MTRCLLLLIGIVWFPTVTLAQGVLIDSRHPVPLPRPRPAPQGPTVQYGVEELRIDARVQDQLASVQVSQVFRNTGAQTLESQFVFPLPYDGAIDSVILLVNGKELPGKLLNAEDARKRYEEIVRRNRDPALLQWIGTGLFQTSVFPIPPGETRTVTLTYRQLLRKTDSLLEFLFPLATARYSSQPVKELSLKLQIQSATELKTLFSPSHNVTVERSGPNSALVTYSAKNTIPTADFRLFVDSQKGDVGMSLLSYHPAGSEDGFFLLLASPKLGEQAASPVSKTVSFLVDTSGSMSGVKMEQTRDAARFLLNQLAEEDLFNLVTFDSRANVYRPELERLTSESRAAALTFVSGLNAGGGTNLGEALAVGLSQLQDRSRPSYVLLLTDGQPTSGETSESRIAQAAKLANQARARLLVFGVGYDVNSRLLDRLSREHHGLSEYVRPDENIEAAVARVFNRISRPMLTGVQLKFEKPDGSQVMTSRIYPGGELDLFAGEQLVVVGRYRTSGPVNVTLNGQIAGEPQTHSLTGDLVAPSSASSHAFIAQLWATRRIGELIDEIDLHGKNPELVEELVRLSTLYGILTPYTAFLADETARPDVTSVSNLNAARRELQNLDAATGQSAFEQRSSKQQFKGAVLNAAPGQMNGPAGVAASTAAPAILFNADQTLYRKGNLIVTPQTAHLDLEKNKQDIQEVTRFSQEYFDLIAQNSKAQNELLSEQNEQEQLLVEFRGKFYLIK